MTTQAKITAEQLNAIAEEAMHLAFAHIAERFDPAAAQDLGGFFGYHAEALSEEVQANLLKAAALADEYLNG